MNTRFRRHLWAAPVLGTCLAGAAMADLLGAPDTQRNFVGCPIVIDTQDVPCWVADYEGERYFLTVQTGRSYGVVFSPQLMHKVLVEGAVTDEPRRCGGIVLTDVKLSVMQEVSPECNTILPDTGEHVTGPRPIGPDGNPPGRVSTAVQQPPAPSSPPRPPALDDLVADPRTHEFVIPYFFDSNYLPFPAEQATVDRAADYAAAISASHVEVVGYRGRVLLSNGEYMVEASELPRLRAEKVADILVDFGVNPQSMTVRWEDEPQDNAGVRDFDKRRVVVTVTP